MDAKRRAFLKSIGAGSVMAGATAAGPPFGGVSVADFLAGRQTIQDAIDAVQRNGGGIVFFPVGTYAVDQPLLVTRDHVRLVGESRDSVLGARAGSQAIIHFAASHGGVENLTLKGKSHSGVTAVQIAPRDPASRKKRVDQNYNRFSNLLITGCAEGITLQAGPQVDGGDSGCWYNVFDNILMIYTRRGLWLKNPVGGRGSGVNRNQFYSVRVGQFVNVGIQIDAGDTNTFFGCSFEGISHGTSPKTTPTAIVIKQSAASGSDNNHNTFISAKFEANTIDLENHNPYTEFFASNVSFGSGKFRGTNPLYVFGGSDPSQTPVIMPGLTYPEGSLPGHDNRWNVLVDATVHGRFTQKNDVTSRYFSAGELEGNCKLVDDSANGSNGSVARHTLGKQWGLYARNIGRFLRKGRYRVIHRYRLISGKAAFGIYNSTKSRVVPVTNGDDLKTDGVYHTATAGYFEIDNQNPPSDVLSSHYHPEDDDALNVEWIRFEESP